jgi:hypothetical protein
MRVLGHDQLLEAAFLERRRQLGVVDALIDREIEDADLHIIAP